MLTEAQIGKPCMTSVATRGASRKGPDYAAVRERIALVDGKDELLGPLKHELASCRDYIRARFDKSGDATVVLRELSDLSDALIRGTLDFAVRNVYRASNPTRGEEVALLAVGGYGRRELAPYSDIDLLFLYPYKRTPHVEQLNEFLLYKLWDMGLKVGQATRSVDETIKMAGHDLTIRTSLLEARLVWGSRDLTDQLATRFRRHVCEGHEAEFIEAKLAEREARHRRTGDTRYLLEPNVKEGKGGLRDLHTLMWIGRFLYDLGQPQDLIKHDILTSDALRTFLRSQRFLWAVRCHLHYLAGRADERLTFDRQSALAARMLFNDRSSGRAVERFMKRYYLVVKDVGALTRIVCAALEEQHKRRPRLGFPRFGLGRRQIGSFVVQGNRLSLGEPNLFETDPRKIIELFAVSDREKLDIHPATLQAVTRNLRRIDEQVRQDEQCNRQFLDILTTRNNPATTLVRMNEAGVIGRFVPDFGRIVALMQHDLYHVFTVDEHTIQALQSLHQIETGQLENELPLATGIIPKLQSRTELYVAAFIHDLGKGRGGNHSKIGATIASRLCPRLGLSRSASETIEWLVANHLLMSDTAFKRDLEDPKTVQDFVEIIQSPERLRLLLVLTAADIRSVGPTVWNGWKGQLLRELFAQSEAAMSSSDTTALRDARVTKAKAAFRQAIIDQHSWSDQQIEQHINRLGDRYWLGVAPDSHIRHAELVRDADDLRRPLTIAFEIDEFRAHTELTVYATDHPGLFMRVAGALAVAGTSIVDAHIFTTADGMALDAIGVQDSREHNAVASDTKLKRIKDSIELALQGELWLEKALEGRRTLPERADIFQVEPRVFINNQASRTHSVIEVNGRDRPGLLFGVAKALKSLGLIIHSAHISTYGERVVDVFYVKDVFGMKIQQKTKKKRIRDSLKNALSGS